MDFRAVIMAGGAGTRFWPLSKKAKPKQFLPIISEKTMVEETVHRILPIFPFHRIYTIANLEQTRILKTLLPDLPKENFLVEPQGKNTAPALLLATARAYLQNPKAVLAALPSDQRITDTPLFLKTLEAGAFAAEEEDFLITFGISPAFPATGYGYIHFSKESPLKIRGEFFYRVKEFKEKPTHEKAKTFLEEGNYLWNSGMFLWQADVFAKKLEKHASELFPFWVRMLDSLESNNEDTMELIFEEIPKISIDYGLMERAEGVLVCQGNFGWSDVGAWSSLADIWPRDKEGNASRGDIIAVDSKGCVSYNPDKLTVLIGVNDLIVVDTEQALLVCHKDKDQKVKDVVSIIEKKGKGEYQ